MTPESIVRLQKMRKAVTELYDRNRQQGHAAWCGLDYDFVCPSTGTYPFQWFWDSCFHAVAMSHIDPVRAQSEITSLLANQQPDGFVAHVTFWQREKYEEMLKTYSISYRTPYLSDCPQPPVLGEAIEAVARRGGGIPFLQKVLPAAKRYYDWWDQTRDPDRDGLISTLQGDESGLDHIPKYDEYLGIKEATLAEVDAAWLRVANAYKPVNRDQQKMFEVDKFNVEDVLVNTIYAEGQRVVGEMCAQIGDTAGAEEFKRRAKKTTEALSAKCFDKERGLFFDLASKDERMLKVSTVSSLMPILLPDLPREQVDALVRHIQDEKEYGAPYPVPSTAMSEPSFMPGIVGTKLVWRGPSWINTNWYISRGLRRHGFETLARRIEDQSAACIEKSGFREYYNPLTGEGHGAEFFSWSALALDMIAAREGF